MKFFKFIKKYREFNKIIDELEKLRRISNVEKTKYEISAANNKSTLASYNKKKAEYHKGKVEAYQNIIFLLNSFIEKD